MAIPFQALLLRGYTITIITAHASGTAHVSESELQARLQVLQNSGSHMFVLRFKPCQRDSAARDRH